MEQVIRSGAGLSVGSYLRPGRMLRELWAKRDLAVQLARRDVVGRYRAARLGLLWSVLTPLILLGIYTFVFTVVFRFRWNDAAPESRGQFALTMFCGMLLFNLFAEVVTRAPVMIVSNPNYVKKVVFPLETFVVSGLLSALFNMLVGFAVWLIGTVLLIGPPPITCVWLPVVLMPVCLLTCGVAWVLAALGVFIRDVGHVVVLGVQVLFFMTPIFYRIEAVPPAFQRFLRINPLAHVVEDARRVLMWGSSPDWRWWLPSLVISGSLALLGYAFFMKSKRAFGDVI